jgi:peptide/nickel transport system ATP-binding protein
MTETSSYLTDQTATSASHSADLARAEPYLVVEDLTVRFPTHDGIVQAVTDMSYSLEQGRTLGIVGESGSGKSVSSMAIMGLHDYKRTRMQGSIRVGGKEIVGLPDNKMEDLRGGEVAMIFQDPLSSLHPFYSIGSQISEAYLAHNKVSKVKARKKAIEMLDRVGIPQARNRVDDYPHQFSGGMRQRAMIAMALVNDPKLLIADEPTTALDVTVQAQILDLLQELQRDFNSAIIIITHDLGVVAEMADQVLVMYGGRVVEHGPTKEILTHPEMPYTWGLLSSVPDVNADTETRLIPIPGNPPSLLNPPEGCAFHPRCPHKDRVPGNLCTTELPPLVEGNRGPGHLKRCHLANPDMIYESEVLPEMLAEVDSTSGGVTTQDNPDISSETR